VRFWLSGSLGVNESAVFVDVGEAADDHGKLDSELP
jgi:hypothetical protein